MHMVPSTQAVEPVDSYPDSWRGQALLGTAVLVVALGGFLAWSLLADLASAVIANGSVVVETSRKTVQHLEGGIVRELLVKEGDLVAEGQLLARLDPIQSRAEERSLTLAMAALRARIARTSAEQEGLPAPAFPVQLAAAAKGDPEVAGILRSERQLFEARRDQLIAERGILANRREHAVEKLAAMQQEVESLGRQAALVTEELSGALELQKKGHATKTRVLALQREHERLLGNASRIRAEIAEQEQVVTESELQILQLDTTFGQQAAEERRNAQGELAELTGRETAAGDRVERLALRAPVAGQVVHLTSRGPASVVKPGETLMEIVPGDGELIVEARVLPGDIDAVAVGQRSEIRFTGLTDRNRDPVFGRVEVVSADRLVDEATQTAYYSVRVAVGAAERDELPAGAFKPGVPAEVLILGQERTLLSYLADPLFGSLRTAFREG